MAFEDGIRSVKREIVKFFESKTQVPSSAKAKDWTKLEELVEGKIPILQAIQKCKVLFSNFAGGELKTRQEDYAQVNRTQEHLSNKGAEELLDFCKDGIGKKKWNSRRS